MLGIVDHILHTASDEHLLSLEPEIDDEYSLINIRKNVEKEGYRVNT